MPFHHSSQEPESTHGSRLSRRMFLGASAVLAAGASLGLSAPAFADTGSRGLLNANRPGETPFGPVQVSASGRYARAVRLTATQPAGTSQTILATYPSGSSFPLYRSEDDGRTWQQSGAIGVTGRASQPFLYELPRAFAGLPKGALLFSCMESNSTSTKIQLFASTDGGVTWQFLSTVAVGGRASTTNGQTPVWEPFLLLNNGKLICYYSDQRDPNFGQKLSHQTSTDLVTWGPVVDDVTGTTYAERPGMTSVARLRGDLWIMTFEYGQPVDPVNPDQANYTYHVHYRLAKDPEEFRFSETIPLVAPGGPIPNAAPIVSWADTGDANGVIVVTDNDDQDFLINRDLGDPAKWTRLSSPMPRGYSRYTIPLDGPGSPQNRGLVFVITGSPYGTAAPVTAGIISVAG